MTDFPVEYRRRDLANLMPVNRVHPLYSVTLRSGDVRRGPAEVLSD